MRRNLLNLALAGALFGLASSARADVLLSWDFAGEGGSASSTAETHAPNISTTAPSSVTSIGPGLDPIDYLGDGLTATGQTDAALADAISDDDYLSFSIAPSTGSALSLDSVDLRPVSQNRSRTFTLFSSEDGFTAGDQIAQFDYKGNFGPDTLVTENLAGFNNLQGNVEFRLYVHGATNGAEAVGLGNNDGEDLVINGTVSPVPEPASLALLGVGGLLMLPRRRKRA